MDQEADEGAMDGTSKGSRSSRRRYGSGRSGGWCKRWKDQWMVQAIDHEAVEGDKWIRKLLKERWVVQAMEGAMDGTSYGSGSSRTNVQAMSRRRY
jgi:hypothetical protein